MSLYRAIKDIILGPTEMATVRLASWTQLTQISHLYQIQHAAENAGFCGWLMLSTRGRLEAEFEGPKDELSDFIDRLLRGKVTGSEIPLEYAWGLYQKRYTQLRLRLADIVVHERPRKHTGE